MSDLPDQTTRIQGCLDRLRAGDPTARDQLLATALDRLTRLTRKMLRADTRVRRWEETDDVRQNASLRLCRALESMQPATVGDFFRLAALQIRRELIDLARHYFGPQGGGRHAAPSFPLADTARADGPWEIAHTTLDPARLAQWTEFHQTIEKLPTEAREVFDLLWYSGLTAIEAAGVLGVSERTVQRRWQAARLGLHDALGGLLPDGAER